MVGSASAPVAALRVMLVDDHAIVRSGFKRLLEQQPNLRVVAEASDADRAYALFLEHSPDVVILDISMPGVSGFECIRRIIERQPDAKIIVFSMHDDAAIADRAIKLGARGYVSKSNEPEVLASALHVVMNGDIALSPDIAKAIAVARLSADGPMNILTAREFEIFRLIAAGKAVPEIARLLNLSAKTIANYHTLIRQKLGISSDVELVLMAQRFQIV
jgi:two-component system invasion response regulator UvrY